MPGTFFFQNIPFNIVFAGIPGPVFIFQGLIPYAADLCCCRFILQIGSNGGAVIINVLVVVQRIAYGNTVRIQAGAVSRRLVRSNSIVADKEFNAGVSYVAAYCLIAADRIRCVQLQGSVCIKIRCLKAYGRTMVVEENSLIITVGYFCCITDIYRLGSFQVCTVFLCPAIEHCAIGSGSCTLLREVYIYQPGAVIILIGLQVRQRVITDLSASVVELNRILLVACRIYGNGKGFCFRPPTVSVFVVLMCNRRCSSCNTLYGSFFSTSADRCYCTIGRFPTVI